MMTNDRRAVHRRSVHVVTRAALEDEERPLPAVIRDISRGGANVTLKQDVAAPVSWDRVKRVTLTLDDPDEGEHISFGFSVQRVRNSGPDVILHLKLDLEPLTSPSSNESTQPPTQPKAGTGTLALSRVLREDRRRRAQISEEISKDRDRLDAQLRDIQSCRATFAITTIGAAFAGLMTTMFVASSAATKAKSELPRTGNGQPHGLLAGLMNESPSQVAIDASFWIVLGLGLGASLLYIGILGAIEKARAINQRKALQLVLAEFSTDLRDLSTYPGLASLLHLSLPSCGWLQANHACPIIGRETPSKAAMKAQRCWETGSETASSVFTKSKRSFDDPTSSFTAFTAAAYSVVWLTYLAAITAFLALRYHAQGLTWSALGMAALVGFGIIILLSLSLYKRASDNKWEGRILTAAVALGVIVWAYSKFDGIDVPNDRASMWMKLITGAKFSIFIFAMTGSIVYLMRLFAKVRRGKYSLMAYYYGWQNAVRKCTPRLAIPSVSQVTVHGQLLPRDEGYPGHA